MEVRKVKTRSPISIANEKVDIRTVCELIGMFVPEIPDGKSVKLHCPFGSVYHRDQGVETAFRVYPSTNSCFCFACNEYFSPVGLAAKAWDLTFDAAADRLLEEIGYKPPSAEEAWNRLTNKQEATVDPTMLSVALKTYCARIDRDWEDIQYIPDVSSVLSRCLNLLPIVKSEAEARQWLEVSKKVMKQALDARVVVNSSE